MSIAVSYHDSVTKLQVLSAYARSPFERSEWFKLLERDRTKVLIASGKTPDSEVALVLQYDGGRLKSLTNWFSFSWRPVESGDQSSSEILFAIACGLKAKTHAIAFAPVPDEDASATRIECTFRKAGWMVVREQCDENHVLSVNGRSFDEYWAQRPGNMRTTLKRKAKKVDVMVHDRFDEAAWSEYQAVYARSWKPDEEQADILEAFAREEGEAGRIRLGIARAEGVPVAAQFWTVENGTAYIHKLAHAEKAKPLSAGTTLSAALFAHAIEIDKVEMIDFGTGSDAYKRDWMEQVRPRYRLTCLDRRQPRAWPAIAKALLRRLAPRNTRR